MRTELYTPLIQMICDVVTMWLTGVRLAAVTAASVSVFPSHKLILTTMQPSGRLRGTSSTAELNTPSGYRLRAQEEDEKGPPNCRAAVDAGSHSASTARSVGLG
jgi:hypothetical protein